MQLRNRRVEHVGIEKEADEFAHGEFGVVLEDKIAADANDAEEAELGQEVGGWVVDGPAKHGTEGFVAQRLGFFFKAYGFTFLQAKSLDEPVALNIFNQ